MLFVKFIESIFVFLCIFLSYVENKSHFEIGARLIGDQLLVKDVLQAPPSGWSYDPEITFNYAIPEPITYIEIVAEENVSAKVNFSYEDDLVKGTITASNSRNHPYPNTTPTTEFDENATKPFMVLIRIYGYNDTVLNLNSQHVLNRNHFFQGILVPNYDDDEDEYRNQSDEAVVETQTYDKDLLNNDTDNDAAIILDGDYNLADDDDDDYFDHTDNIIELGQRQNGDYLIYETFQTSLTTSKEPTNHSIVFYYIDSDFITYVKFVIYDHFVDESLPDKNAPIAEYSHISQRTLKAVITDNHTKSLFAQMSLYGYKPEDRPHTYMPYLMGLHRSTLDKDVPTTMSSVQQLRMWLKSKQLDEMKTTMDVPENTNDMEDNEVSNDNKTAAISDAAVELPLCRNAAFSITSNLLLVLVPSYNFIEINRFWALLSFASLLYSI